MKRDAQVLLDPSTPKALWLSQAEHGRPLSDGEALLVLVQARVDQRRQLSCRAEILRALEAGGCTFKGAIQRRHRALARELERLDAELCVDHDG